MVQQDVQYARASGKCVLFGEYSILHGGIAIALPVPQLSLKISFTPQSKDEIINSENNHSPPLTPLAVELFWKLLEKDFADVSFHGKYLIDSNIPLGAGLGSSAALSVALHRLHHKNISHEELVHRSWQSENLFHGKSSGMDPCTIANEKALCFESPTQYHPLKSDLLQNKDFVFVLIDSKIRRSTQSGISKTELFKKENPEGWEKNTKELQELAFKGKEFFESSKVNDLAKCMNRAHEVLRERQVSHPELELLREKLLKDGALGAKLTGAGCGGFLLALFNRTCWNSLKSRQDASAYSFFELGL